MERSCGVRPRDSHGADVHRAGRPLRPASPVWLLSSPNVQWPSARRALALRRVFTTGMLPSTEDARVTMNATAP